ncbi:MAG: acyl-ACP--UDP-N-acetylglucosamine O-acyltransferase [Methylococcaceae bacterium]
MIHSTAIIDPGAEIASDVQVGPYVIIGPDVIIESGTWIGPHAVIKGPTRIGQNNKLFQFVSVGEDPQDKKYRGETTRLDIGDNNIIREYATLHRGTVQDRGVTTLGNGNLLMAYTHVAHDCIIGDNVIMANGASLAGHVRLDDYAILGGFSLVHQFCKIGRFGFSAMGSVISRDVLPYVLIGGTPTKPRGINNVGLERTGYSPETIRQIRKAYKTIYKSGLMLEEALQILMEMSRDVPEIICMVDFLQQTDRSIIR